MNVVCDRFDARDFRFEIFPEAAAATRWRLGAESWSEPERLETVGVAGAAAAEESVLTRLRKGEIASEGVEESDF